MIHAGARSMGKEHRMESLFTTDTATGNNIASFKNTTDNILKIRKVNMLSFMEAAAVAESCLYELGKSTALVGSTNNNSIPFVSVTAVGQVAGADAVAATKELFPEGALELEPNESLYLHTVISGTVTCNGTVQIWYHF